MVDVVDIATEFAERERAALTRRPSRPSGPRVGSAACVECGEPIEADRLAVLPHARKCAFRAGARVHE